MKMSLWTGLIGQENKKVQMGPYSLTQKCQPNWGMHAPALGIVVFVGVLVIKECSNLMRQKKKKIQTGLSRLYIKFQAHWSMYVPISKHN